MTRSTRAYAKEKATCAPETGSKLSVTSLHSSVEVYDGPDRYPEDWPSGNPQHAAAIVGERVGIVAKGVIADGEPCKSGEQHVGHYLGDV